MSKIHPWYGPFKVFGKEYKFVDMDDEPLRLELKYSEDYILYRDINCDELSERIFLIHFYGPLTDNLFERKHLAYDVYKGKEIEDIQFMNQLLEYILYKLNPINGKDI